MFAWGPDYNSVFRSPSFYGNQYKFIFVNKWFEIRESDPLNFPAESDVSAIKTDIAVIMQKLNIIGNTLSQKLSEEQI
ncbi:hypothetical protein EAE91_13850 [Photorhabdus noenieputensis]|nr:hypothetical protein [Photorhabdus noenieputensis]